MKLHGYKFLPSLWLIQCCSSGRSQIDHNQFCLMKSPLQDYISWDGRITYFDLAEQLLIVILCHFKWSSMSILWYSKVPGADAAALPTYLSLGGATPSGKFSMNAHLSLFSTKWNAPWTWQNSTQLAKTSSPTDHDLFWRDKWFYRQWTTQLWFVSHLDSITWKCFLREYIALIADLL